MSIFTMDHVNQVMAMSQKDGVAFVRSVIADDQSAKPVTKAKALRLVEKAQSPTKLAHAMSSWILAHPDEGLKVL